MSGRRLSLWRVCVVVAVLGAIAYVGWVQARGVIDRVRESPSRTYFAPYVDVTLTPSFAFEDAAVSPSKDVVLGFVVADPRHPCLPSWGTYYDLDGADQALDLERRIERLRERGGDAVVSFGGAANEELAVTCASEKALTASYAGVIERYALRTIDLDLEGAALADAPATRRRARAMRHLQTEAQRNGRPLHIWLTLPVAPTGLTSEGLAQVRAMYAAGVHLAGVNLMTMNYAESRGAGMDMFEASRSAVDATATQLVRLSRRAGRPLTRAQAYRHLGATPMIGQNDVERDVFSLKDAGSLVGYAERVSLGRVSMWSANRDYPCGTGSPRLSNTCSGVPQEPLAFTWQLGRLDASMPARQSTQRGDAAERAVSRDDPRTSPYPIWNADATYTKGDKVVWHGRVYVAKWWAQNDAPDAPVAHPWDSPWREIGPVMPADAAAARRPERTARPALWSDKEVYLRGDRVRWGRYLYEAKWWTQGDEPEPEPARALEVPWTLVGAVPKGPAPVAPVLPSWYPRRTYAPGTTITHRGRRYVATAWTRGQAPGSSGASPWRYLGSDLAQR